MSDPTEEVEVQAATDGAQVVDPAETVVEALDDPMNTATRTALQLFKKSMRFMTPSSTDDDKDPARRPNTLSFESLTVLVPRIGWNACNCLDSPIRHYATEYLGVAVEKKDAFFAIDCISGHVQAGEMVLVLTANELAASTLIRALTGRLSPSSDQLSGSLLWNGIPIHSDHLQGWRRMAPYVSARDDSHSAVLTVRETLQFAAECTAGARSGAVNERVDHMLEILGISHVADTVVGDDNLRGISGGQKRRVTVGEMLLNPDAAFLGLENITDGREFRI